jgi:hypothetical protein
MKNLWSFLYRVAAAIGFGVGGTISYKDEASKAPAPIESQRVRYAPGGTLQKIDKHYGTTIAGGPGSQKIGDTFAALPQAERDKMIAARKGVVRQLQPGETETMDGTVSIIQRRTVHEDGSAYIFYPTGSKWTSAEARDDLPLEIAQGCELALERLNQEEGQ